MLWIVVQGVTPNSHNLILANVGLSFPENAKENIIDRLVELEEALLKLLSNHSVLNSEWLFLRTVFALGASFKRIEINSNAHGIVTLY